MQTFELMDVREHEPGVETSIQKWRQIEKMLAAIKYIAQTRCGLCLMHPDLSATPDWVASHLNCECCEFGDCNDNTNDGIGNVLELVKHADRAYVESGMILARLVAIREAAKTVIKYEDPENDYARE